MKPFFRHLTRNDGHRHRKGARLANESGDDRAGTAATGGGAKHQNADLVALLDPRWMRVIADFNVRGNIKTVVRAEHGIREKA